ncbi:hypothetical protein CK203_087158 [Vitis vinifera]|uniref:Retrotransposon gag domain-containing protein n=1 Tax=Vitis vinifera TaxID=29760 RepID=A0A438D8X6_VITVI|nr:hypothetical protein CK203_087158 [Vitis vinifera]
MELELKVDSKIYVYRWSTDLVIAHLTVDTFMTPEFSSYVQISDCHLRTMCLYVVLSSFRVLSRVLHSADSYPSSDSSVEMSDELASTLASIQEFMAGVSRRLDQIESSRQDPHPAGMVTDETIPHASQTTQTRPPGVSLGTPFHLADHYETIPLPIVTVPPPMVPTIEDTRLAEQEAKVERLESTMRQIRLQDGGLTWDDRDGISAASLPAKFRMPDIERYSGIGCPKIHLRLYSTVMRAHGIDDAQLVTLFPMSLSGAAQRWFASVEPSRLRTWGDVAHEFLTQFAFSADIDVYLDESWRPPDRGQTSLFLPLSLVGGQKWLDLRSLVHAAFSVEEAMARGLWTDTTPSLTVREEADWTIEPPLVRAHFLHPRYQYQPDYVQEPYIAQTSMQPRPSHPRATTHPPPRPYAKRPARQFTPLGMTLTRAFEKLRDAGVIVPLAPRPLPHPIPPHFRSHEHCLYHQIPGHDTEHCSTLHHAIQDLIDSGLVDLAGPNVTTNPLPAHSTHAVPPPPGLSRLIWMLRVLMAYGVLGSSRMRTWVSRMGTSLGSSSVKNISHFDYGHHQTHFHFVESSFQFIRVVFVLLSPVFRFRVIVFSFMLRVQLFVALYHFTHDVLIGSFSDMIFYLSIVAFFS